MNGIDAKERGENPALFLCPNAARAGASCPLTQASRARPSRCLMPARAGVSCPPVQVSHARPCRCLMLTRAGVGLPLCRVCRALAACGKLDRYPKG
ncbi:hypothetical protein [Treponema endosymbiont of Eucomonympha sp.]|uniref:hypothetical protein n=1 Tax=Treponema endosymbiont of Eucomonympha sp. TaxID=1580831 RepID=UPI000AD97B96|nr:hypothetical protein [Treponema endosymbiont of Eucomonympha sp.]